MVPRKAQIFSWLVANGKVNVSDQNEGHSFTLVINGVFFAMQGFQ